MNLTFRAILRGHLHRYKGRGTKWFKGVISRDNRDGTYDLTYDDGDKDFGALTANIRSLDGGGGGGGGGSPDRGSGVSASFREGDKVEGL